MRTKKKSKTVEVVKPAKSDVVGKCPYDSQQLEEKDDKLICGNHFAISRSVYMQAWDMYDAGEISAEELLDSLIANNKSVNKPILNTSLERINDRQNAKTIDRK